MWLESHYRRGLTDHSLFGIQTSLARNVPPLKFDLVALSDCFDFITDIAGYNSAQREDSLGGIRSAARPRVKMRQPADELNVDWKKLSSVRVEKTTPRSIEIANIPLGSTFIALTKRPANQCACGQSTDPHLNRRRPLTVPIGLSGLFLPVAY